MCQSNLPSDPQDAATVLLVRDAAGGPEVYMVERHSGNRFMAGAHVFVGGRVDPDDSAPELASRCVGITPADAAEKLGISNASRALALYVAVLREAFEESGLLVAIHRDGAAPRSRDRLAQLAALRVRLNAGDICFADLLEQLDLVLPLDQLRYLAHWITPPFERQRFDTRFFVCRAPVAQQAVFDARETTSGSWYRLPDVLEAHAREQVQLAPPTLCVLDDLHRAQSVDELLALAPDQPVIAVHPRVLAEAQELTVLLPGDHRYADPNTADGALNRLVRKGQHWQRVCAEFRKHPV